MRRGVFQCFGEQSTQHPGGVHRQCQGPGVGAESGCQHHQRGPHQFGNGAQGVKHEARRTLQRPTETTGRRQRQHQAEYRREQGAEGRHGHGFHGATADGLQMAGAQVRAEKTQHVGAHLLQVTAARQFAEVDAQVAERGHDRRADTEDQQQVEKAIHANLQRNRRLI
ncbi:hypothetical protein D3C71_1466500 [compost metagenome]